MNQKEIYNKVKDKILSAFEDGKDSGYASKILERYSSKYEITVTTRNKLYNLIGIKRADEINERVLQNRMTVGKLIEKLQGLDHNQPVIIDGRDYCDDDYEGDNKHIVEIVSDKEAVYLVAGEIY